MFTGSVLMVVGAGVGGVAWVGITVGAELITGACLLPGGEFSGSPTDISQR